MQQPGANGNRPGGSKPAAMMPPPSPVTNGVPKSATSSQQGPTSGPIKQEPSSNAPTPGQTDVSPRSQPASAPTSATAGPSTPNPAPSNVPSPSPLLHNANSGNTSRPATANATPQQSNSLPSQPPQSTQQPMASLAPEMMQSFDFDVNDFSSFFGGDFADSTMAFFDNYESLDLK